MQDDFSFQGYPVSFLTHLRAQCLASDKLVSLHLMFFMPFFCVGSFHMYLMFFFHIFLNLCLVEQVQDEDE